MGTHESHEHSFPRILGLFRNEGAATGKIMETVVYVHTNASGASCVNGAPARIVFREAGIFLQEAAFEEGVLCCILSPGAAPRERDFLAVRDGECLLRRCGEKAGHNVLEVVSPGFLAVSSPVETWAPIRAGILTASDKGSRGERVDTAGPALADLMRALGADIAASAVVPDDRARIAEEIVRWVDEDDLHLIWVAGGTGLAERDTTPEAVLDIAHRQVPGIGEAIRAAGNRYTPRAYLTRSVAVVRSRTLVIPCPGSERGARQAFEAVRPFLRHGIDILRGEDAECGSRGHRV